MTIFKKIEEKFFKEIKKEFKEDSLEITYKYSFFLHICFSFISFFSWFFDIFLKKTNIDNTKVDNLIYKFDKTNIQYNIECTQLSFNITMWFFFFCLLWLCTFLLKCYARLLFGFFYL
jgi:hypothetical protein